MHLGLDTRLIPQELSVYFDFILNSADWEGVAEDPYIANYPDPNDMLSFFTANYPHWSDPEFDRMLAAASATPESLTRMERLSACEARLLRAMPCVPLYFDTWNYLERHDVRGLRLSPLNTPSLKYAWIDASRSPSI